MKNKRKATIYDLVRLKNRECPKETCLECPLSIDKNGRNIYCPSFIRKFTDEANETILRWCDEHPVKTYADDFFEKFPDEKRNAYGVPYVCPKRIYPQFEQCPEVERCAECWKMEFRNEGES